MTAICAQQTAAIDVSGHPDSRPWTLRLGRPVEMRSAVSALYFAPRKSFKAETRRGDALAATWFGNALLALEPFSYDAVFSSAEVSASRVGCP